MNKLLLLKRAILNQKTLTFRYDNKLRKVEPHHVGLLCNKLQLHSFQEAGESVSGGIPEWRNFIIAKMKNVKLNSSDTFSIRESYNPVNSHYSTIITSVFAKNK